MSDNEIRLPEGLDVETATDVLREFARVDGEPTIVSESTLDSLREEINEAKEAFAAVLAEESPQSADTLARQDMDALTEPFRDEETGDIDVDTLRQTPETGDTGADAGDGGDADGSTSIDALSLDDRQELQRLKKKRNAFEKRGIDTRVDALEAEMAALAGVDDASEIDWEDL